MTAVPAAVPHRSALLDTSAVIDFPAARVAAYARTVAVSTISLAELAVGLHTPSPVDNARRSLRYGWVLRTFDVIPFDAGCAETYGALCATVRERGRTPRPRRFDLLIAAVAVRHDLPLLTRNPRDFAHLDVSLVIHTL